VLVVELLLVVVGLATVVVVELVPVPVDPASVVVELVPVPVDPASVVVELVPVPVDPASVVVVVVVVDGGTGAGSHDDNVVEIFEVTAALVEPCAGTIRLPRTSSPIATVRARRIPRARIIRLSKAQQL